MVKVNLVFMEAQRSDRKTDFFPIQPTSNVLRKTYVNQNSSKYKYIGLKSVEAQNGPKNGSEASSVFFIELVAFIAFPGRQKCRI